MNQLTAARFDGCTESDADYTYDGLGTIKSKLHVGDYAYDNTVVGPHAVTAANGLSYHYDANGNLTEVVYGDPYQRKDSIGDITYYVGKLFEETSDGLTTQFVHYIGDFALYVDKRGVDAAAYHEYLHRDHLGSIVAKTSDRNTAAEWLAYAPWGSQLSVAWDSPFPLAQMTDASSTRGFTDHEHLDPVGLIHMNGRVYDPELGRFLSPDPFIQSPYNSQSYNRYSYVFNNPLSFTDPTGYFCSGYVEDGCQEEVIVIGNRSAAETARQQEAMQNASNAYYASVSAPGNWMRASNTFFNMDYFYNASLGQAPQINPMSVAWESGGTSVAYDRSEAGSFFHPLLDSASDLRLSADVGAAFGGFGANLSGSREVDGDNPSLRFAWASGLGLFGGAFLEGSPLTIGELGEYTQSASFVAGKGLAGKFLVEWGPKGFRITTGIGGGLGLKANIVDFGKTIDLNKD